MRKLVIVQQYVPSYRVPFFNLLHTNLIDNAVELKVAASVPSGSLASRNDSADAEWIIRIPENRIGMFGKDLILGGSFPSWQDAEGVILPLQGTFLDAYRAVFRAKKSGQSVGLWGHVDSYVNAPNPFDMAAERWLMKQADRIFAYSTGGSDYAIRSGINADKITTVMNSIDTTSLELMRDSIGSRQVDKFRADFNISSDHVISYIGALDSSKRIDFLCDVLDDLWIKDPSICLLVGGRGAQEFLLQAAIDRGQCKMLGYVDDETKALMGHISRAITIPGRIGLVAVESLVLGLPILSTDWAFHAPEREYLKEGETLFSSTNNVDDYTNLILSTFAGDEKISSRSEVWSYPTLENMVNNYTQGIVRMLSK